MARARRSTLFPYTTLFRSCDTPSQGARLLGNLPERNPRTGSPPFSRGLARSERFELDRKSTRLNSSHLVISYAVFCLKKKIAQANIYELKYLIDIETSKRI